MKICNPSTHSWNIRWDSYHTNWTFFQHISQLNVVISSRERFFGGGSASNRKLLLHDCKNESTIFHALLSISWIVLLLAAAHRRAIFCRNSSKKCFILAHFPRLCELLSSGNGWKKNVPRWSWGNRSWIFPTIENCSRLMLWVSWPVHVNQSWKRWRRWLQFRQGGKVFFRQF